MKRRQGIVPVFGFFGFGCFCSAGCQDSSILSLTKDSPLASAKASINRLIMMNGGKIILDVSGKEKKQLTIELLMDEFAKASGETFVNDRMLLS